MRQSIYSIPCVLHGNNTKNRPHIAQTLANIGKCNQIPFKNISDYTDLLAHGCHLFEHKRFSIEELENAFLENPNPNYCADMKKDINSLKKHNEFITEHTSAIFCLICPYGNPENEKRKELEKTVLTALAGRIIRTSDFKAIGEPSEIFLSWTDITLKEYSGTCPITRLHFYLYHALSYLLISNENSPITSNEIASFFNQIFFTFLQTYAAMYKKHITELTECFYKKILTVFYSPCTKTKEEIIYILKQLKENEILLSENYNTHTDIIITGQKSVDTKNNTMDISFKSGKPLH